MEKDKFQELLEGKRVADHEPDKIRTPVTILFSDIKGSTAYFEKHGDVAGMAMLERHNDLLFPQIESNGGRVVKTIGDSIMASFEDPVCAVKAGVGMQRALAMDRKQRPEEEHIHIRLGLHTGFGLLKENDIFGDVVNAASRVQRQAQPGQILITDVLLDSAKAAGLQCAAFGKAEMRGKDEPIDVYAVAWSDAATDQLIEEIQARFDIKLKEFKRQYEALEQEFENSREQWRAERRKMAAEMVQLEDQVALSRQKSGSDATGDLHAHARFELQQAIHVKEDLEQQLATAEAKWNAERNNFKAQIAAMQGAVIEAMENSNNPSRMTLAIREQVEARLAGAKQEWELQWEAEQRRLNSEIERLKGAGGVSEERKEAARRAVLEKLGKLPSDAARSAAKSPDQLRKELEDAKRQWDSERDELMGQIKRLENEVARSGDLVRMDVFQELRSEFEPKLFEADQDRQRLAFEVQSLTSELKQERERMAGRIVQLVQAVKEAETTARTQAAAEIHAQFDSKLEDADRLRTRAERKLQDISEELEGERRRSKRDVAQLEEQLKEAREAAFKATRQVRS